jgi:hypothetical protein
MPTRTSRQVRMLTLNLQQPRRKADELDRVCDPHHGVSDMTGFSLSSSQSFLIRRRIEVSS